MRIEKIKIENLKAAKYNPRKNLQPGDPDYEKLKKSIIEFDYIEPIVWNARSGNVVGGHQRLKILKELGHAEVDVDVSVVDLDENKEKALNLALNKTGGTWDIPMLSEIVESLSQTGMDMDITGFSDKEIAELIAGKNGDEIVEDDFDADAAAKAITEPVTHLGDMWLLGRHRLMCADSTIKEDIVRIMDSKKAELVFTDLPYGVNVKGGSKANKTIAGDLTQVAIPFSFDLAVDVATTESARLYFCGGEGNLALYDKLFNRSLNQLPRHLIWVKNGFVLKPNNYHNQYEIIYFGYKPKGGGLNNWFAGRTESEASDVWIIKRDSASTYEHPTQKPIELPSRAIRNSSPVNAIVYEPFCGSGSTLIACEQLSRICYAMEIDPKYCDVIIKRWETFTGQKAIKKRKR